MYCPLSKPEFLFEEMEPSSPSKYSKEEIDNHIYQFLQCRLCNSSDTCVLGCQMLTCGHYICSAHKLSADNKSVVTLSNENNIEFFRSQDEVLGSESTFRTLAKYPEPKKSDEDDDEDDEDADETDEFEEPCEPTVIAKQMWPVVKFEEKKIFCKQCVNYQEISIKKIAPEISRLFDFQILANHNNPECISCEKEDGTFVCLTCKQFHCDSHADLHKKSKTSSNHIITPRIQLQKMKHEWTAAYVEYCPEHEKNKVEWIDLETLDKYCSAPCCRPQGKDQIQFLRDYRNSVTVEKQKKAITFNKNLMSKIHELQNIECKNDSITKANISYIQEEIEKTFELLGSELERRKQELLAQLNTIDKKEEKLMQKRTADLECSQTEVEFLDEFSKRLQAHTPLSTSLLHNNITDALEVLSWKMEKVHPYKPPTLRFTHSAPFIRQSIESISLFIEN
jgi:hypothetical protein